MKYLPFIILLFSSLVNAQINDEKYNDLLKKSPFNEMYPKYMAHEAAEYFNVFNTLFSEKSPIAIKEARLAAVAVSAAIKCEYCVSAQVHLAKKAGANKEEIKAAIQIAAEIQRFSTLLYGNEFGLEKLEKLIGKEK